MDARRGTRQRKGGAASSLSSEVDTAAPLSGELRADEGADSSTSTTMTAQNGRRYTGTTATRTARERAELSKVSQ